MCCGGDVVIADVLFVVQVGDGTTIQRNTPVGVVGLSSGVAMVSLGAVRLFVIAKLYRCVAYVCGRERSLCVFD